MPCKQIMLDLITQIHASSEKRLSVSEIAIVFGTKYQVKVGMISFDFMITVQKLQTGHEKLDGQSISIVRV